MNSLMEDFGVALVMMIVAAFLGGLIVYLWFRNRYTRLQDRNNQLSGEASELRSRFGALEDQVNAAEARARDCSAQLEPIRTTLSAKEKALVDAEANVKSLSQEVADLTPFKVEFEDLQHRYDTLEASVKELQAQRGKKAPVAKVETVKPEANMSAVSEELAREKAVRLSLQEQLEGLRPFRQKYEDLKAKYDALAQGGAPAEEVITPAVAKQEQPKPKKESQEETLARIQERAREINFDRIGVASSDEKDDLKLVKGIGPFIEKKLNSIGIYTFRQISAFTPEDEDKVNEVIEFFPGRIRRDEWSRQAGELHQEKEEKKD